MGNQVFSKRIAQAFKCMPFIGHSKLSNVPASMQKNLSSGFSSKLRLQTATETAKKKKFHYSTKFKYDTFLLANYKGVDQTEQMHRLVCAFVVRKPLKTGFLTSEPSYYTPMVLVCIKAGFKPHPIRESCLGVNNAASYLECAGPLKL